MRQLRGLAGLAVLCGSVYVADDFVRAFGIRALPIGVLVVIGICWAIVGVPSSEGQGP